MLVEAHRLPADACDEMNEEFERRIVDCKKRLGQENVEQTPILDGDNDPLNR